MSRRRFIFRPFTLAYYFLLFILLAVLVPYIALYFRGLLVQGLGLPPEFVGLFLLLSLVGSSVNVPLIEVESRVPIMDLRDFRFFGVRWRIPRLGVGVRKTLIAVNVGGTLIPLAVCVYMLLWSIPAVSPDSLMTYSRLAVVLLIVSIVVKRSSRLIKGIGIATPAFVPPLTTALATMLLHVISPTSCPTQIAYIGGTLGTLIGADLLNLGRISELGAPMVSIGGAGTFDGIYTTGLVSVLMVLVLI